MSKHTPGPWTAEQYETGAFFILKRRGNDEELVLCQRTPHMTRAEEFLANARLIAAAPEMADAVYAFVAWLDAEDGKPDYGTLERDTHPEGERIWREWFDRNLRLCRMAQGMGHAAIARIEGDVP